MEWRCEWCGKPHEENDPPCDNCGHGQFEKAVVPRTDLAEGEGGPEATLVWVCTECGREHPKHAPPCSRCGNATLEKQRQRVDESELSAPGYVDLLTPQYAALIGIAAVFAVVLALGVTGVVDLPGMGTDVPDVEDVPGNATAVDGIPLAAIEDAYVDELNDQREARGVERLERAEGLDEVATFFNQRQVKRTLAGGDPIETGTLNDLLGRECRTDSEVDIELASVGLDEGTDAEELGTLLATDVVEDEGWRPDSTRRTTGVDVHSADGQLYLTQFVCES